MLPGDVIRPLARTTTGATAPHAPRSLVMVIHDVAAATLPACQRMIDSIRERADIPMSLLVVPYYHGTAPDRRLERWLGRALASGDELVLHGFTHRDEGHPQGWRDYLKRNLYTTGEGEFSALSTREASSRMLAGRLWFAANGWPLQGFVAPAWLMSTGTRQALMERGFNYTATVSRLIRLPSQQELPARSLVCSSRSIWRRVLSQAWNRTVAQLERDAPVLRFELHPPDFDCPRLRACWFSLLADALAEREALTLAEAVRNVPDALWLPAPDSLRSSVQT